MHNEDIYVQIEKLIRSFYNKRVSSYFEDYSYQDKFVDTAMFFILEQNILDKWNSNRSKLSTFIFYVLKQNLPIFIFQIRYNLSFRQAKSLYRCYYDKTVTSDFDHILNIYSPLSYDIVNTDESSGKDMDSSWLENIKDNKINVEREVEAKITLNKIQDIITHKPFSDKQTEILKFYISTICDESKTAKHFNCSRQYVHTIVQKLRKVLKQRGITTNY